MLPVLSLDLSEPGALAREWLVADGLGGYASGTVGGVATRRYHGLFIPAVRRNERRVMLAALREELEVGGARFSFTPEALRDFRLEGLVPCWTFALGGVRIERRLLLVHGERTLCVSYRQLGEATARLRLRPFPSGRPHHGPLAVVPRRASVETSPEGALLLRCGDDAPPMSLRLTGNAPCAFAPEEASEEARVFSEERARGYDWEERLASPGAFHADFGPGDELLLVASLETSPSFERAFSLEADRERATLAKTGATGRAARLVLAADPFLAGDTVIAGYPWFTDWGRDTMIALEGLCLCTGRFEEAKRILRRFAAHVRDGLIPNLFPEGGGAGEYHTADATLWFFHAVARTHAATGDLDFLRELFPALSEIVAAHLRGTRFGIRVANDGLLTQGESGLQLTWMDAKVDGWVVTPRRGKAVELSALWFNALSLMREWAGPLGEDPARYAAEAERTKTAFDARFWNEASGCLFDVVDGERGDDPSVRPNQLFAISLDHPVLRPDRWAGVLGVVERELLTSVGLRTLAPSHPDYRARYEGDVRSRDAAYHQGTVWPWLLGHFVDAERKLGRRTDRLAGLFSHLDDAGLGQVSEIFDAALPHAPRGCPAQAWSVAELLRLTTRET